MHISPTESAGQSDDAATSTAKAQGVQQRISQGFIALVVRQILAYGSIFVGNLLLARWVTPEIYGSFAAALAFQTTLIILGEGGIGLALIQREQEPTEQELAALFTLQMLLFTAVAAVVWVIAPWLSQSVELGNDGVLIIRILAVLLVLTSFRTIPAMLLERELNFNAVAAAEVVSTVTYQVVLLLFVWFGTGLFSIIWALGARYLVDLVIIIGFRPWRPRLSSSLHKIFPYIKFGISMQGVRVLAYLKDYLPILVLASSLGAAQAGYWSWAVTYTGIPVYLTRVIDRLVFPAYSRVQHDRAAMGSIATQGIWLTLTVGLPLLLVLVVFGPHLVPLLYTAEWLAALPTANLLALNMFGGFIVGALFPLLYATGQMSQALRVFGLWILLTGVGLVLGVVANALPLIAIGYSCATTIVAILLLYTVKPTADLRLRQALEAPVLAVLIAGCLAVALSRVAIPWAVTLSVSLIAFSLVLLCIARSYIHSMLRLR